MRGKKGEIPSVFSILLLFLKGILGVCRFYTLTEEVPCAHSTAGFSRYPSPSSTHMHLHQQNPCRSSYSPPIYFLLLLICGMARYRKLKRREEEGEWASEVVSHGVDHQLRTFACWPGNGYGEGWACDNHQHTHQLLYRENDAACESVTCSCESWKMVTVIPERFCYQSLSGDLSHGQKNKEAPCCFQYNMCFWWGFGVDIMSQHDMEGCKFILNICFFIR